MKKYKFLWAYVYWICFRSTWVHPCVVHFLPSVKRDAGHCLSWCLLSLYCLSSVIIQIVLSHKVLLYLNQTRIDQHRNVISAVPLPKRANNLLANRIAYYNCIHLYWPIKLHITIVKKIKDWMLLFTFNYFFMLLLQCDYYNVQWWIIYTL